jgi:hypothetical protein
MRARLSLAAAAALLVAACSLAPAYLKPAAPWALDGGLPAGPPLAEAPCAVYKLERYVNTYADGRTSVYTSRDTYVDQVLEDRPRFGARHDYAPLLKALAPAVARFLLPAGLDCPLTVGLQFENFIPRGAARYTFILRVKERATGVERLRITRERLFDAEPGEGAAVVALLGDAAEEVRARRDELVPLVTAPVTAPAETFTRVFVLEPEIAPALAEAAARRALLASLLERALAGSRRYEVVGAAVRDELLAPPGAPPCGDEACRLTRLSRLPGLDAVLASAVAAADGGCTVRLALLPADHGPALKTIYVSTGCGLAPVVDALREAAAELTGEAATP